VTSPASKGPPSSDALPGPNDNHASEMPLERPECPGQQTQKRWSVGVGVCVRVASQPAQGQHGAQAPRMMVPQSESALRRARPALGQAARAGTGPGATLVELAWMLPHPSGLHDGRLEWPPRAARVEGPQRRGRRSADQSIARSTARRGRTTPRRGTSAGVPTEDQRARREVERASIRDSTTTPIVGVSPAARPLLVPPRSHAPYPIVPATNLTARVRVHPSSVGPSHGWLRPIA
jgi:hypothetical protein